MKERLFSAVSKLKGKTIENAYCIIMSKYRVYQGIALCKSLLKHSKNKESFKIFILCMDHDTLDILSKMKIPNQVLVRLTDVETNELRLIKNRKKLNEYCWTLKPVFLEYVLKEYSNVERVTQLDADLYFYSDPSPIFTNQPNCSVLLSDHDFPIENKRKNESAAGKTNSGIISFKREKSAFDCLKWWRKRCLEWCYDRVEDNKFSDQRYLDKTPDLFSGVGYIHTSGVNIAPWNEMKYTTTQRDQKVYVGDHKLIFYHFCGLRIRNKREYSLILEKKEPIPIIYEPYLNTISEVISDIEKINPEFNGFQIEERFKDIEKIHVFSAREETSWKNKYAFATIVSNKYLYKSIVMYRSLVKYCKDFHLFILCVDKEAHNIIKDMNLDWVTCISLDEVEDKDLLKAKHNRSELEYCWTLKPTFLHYVVAKYQSFRYYALIDADLYFFDKPKRIFKEAPDAGFYLTDHNNSEGFKHLYDKTGIINSGFVGCRNHENALSALKWWKNKCIEWCSVHYDMKAKLYADQRYLERWHNMFPNVHIVQTKGGNVATWNIEGYQVSERDGNPYVNEDRVIFYHFSGLSIFGSKEFNLSWFNRLEDKVVKYIYLPYVKELAQVIKEIKTKYPDFSGGFVPKWDNPVHYLKI